ncbi:MAG: hypothetical protein IPJ20_10115 [Flammeovirgaceae bacterium]|nr:hypothetical protein [Flammeovirgaceae bacterium]
MVDTLKISVTKVLESRLKKTDLSNVPFGTVFTDYLFRVDFRDGEWGN